MMLRGFLRLPRPWTFSAICVPALLLYILVRLAIENHRDEAPAVRLWTLLGKLYPPSKRGKRALDSTCCGPVGLNGDALQFKILDHVPTAEEEEVLRNAAAVYTDDMSLRGERFLFDLSCRFQTLSFDLPTESPRPTFSC